MAETMLIIQTLKKVLRKRGVTYFHIADHLGLSEASVKKMLSQNKLSLDRLDKICALLGFEISDLIERVNSDRSMIESLSYEQEKELVSDIRLLIVAVSVIDGFTFEGIVRKYRIAEKECVQYFARLERLKIIRVLPNDGYRLMVRKSFAWIADGPIQKYFHEHLLSDFFSSSFSEVNEKLVLAVGVLTEASGATLIKKMERLAAEFSQLAEDDKPLPFIQKKGTSMVLAFRPWQAAPFQEMMKDSE